MSTKPKRLTDSRHFNAQYGWFHHIWAINEAMIDCAIGKFLRLNFAETHILTAGMEHGRKVALLRNLVSRSDHQNKAKILRPLKIIQNESLRNVFAHSYIASDDKTIFFIDRSRGGPYRAKEHKFSMTEFEDHVEKFSNASVDLQTAIVFEPLEIEAFQAAALRVKNKP